MAKEGKHPGGRPPFEPTKEQRNFVAMGAALLLRHENIARCIINPRTEKPIDDKTLRKHFREELDTGLTKVQVNTMAQLVSLSNAGVPSPTIFLGKTVCGLVEAKAPDDDSKDTNVTIVLDGKRIVAENGGND